MKTNLDSLFKNNEQMEKDGIWFNTGPKTGFLLRRFGGANSQKVKASMSKHFKPYTYQINSNTLEEAKEQEILARVFAESCLLDWRGVEIDGKETPFSMDKAVEFLVALPELANVLREYASDSKNYREELGNS